MLEEDGTVLDEDDILMEFAGAVLLLLQKNETWKSVPKEDQPIPSPSLEASTTSVRASTSTLSTADFASASGPTLPVAELEMSNANIEPQEDATCLVFQSES